MRAFAAFLGALLLTGLISACIAYPAFVPLAGFGWPFHRVASRIAMLVLALVLAWLCRRFGVRSKRDFGYGLPWRRFLAQSLLWGLVGMATAGVGAAFLIATDLRALAPGAAPGAGTWLHWLLVGLGSGVTVALIEETTMRGGLHTAIERESGPWAAALLTAPLFAVLHFFAKARIPPEALGWHSGFDLLTLSFTPLAQPLLVMDSFLSWLVVGLILSMTRVLTGNVAVAVGLHAGWVVVLRMLQEATVRTASTHYGAWVGSFDGLLGYWLVPWGGAIALGLWLARGHWVPAARSP
jgi:membrane protease YdiL (CAAX protease family)